jgi:MFS family permease
MSPGILLIAAGQTVVWAGLFYVFPAMLLEWEQGLGFGKVELTAAFSVALLVSAVCAPVAGRMIDMGHGRWIMAGSTLIGALGLLILSQVQMVWQFYLCWILIGGCCAGCLYESCFALVTRALGADARAAIVRITLMAGFAGSLSFPAVHFLSAIWDWRLTLQVFALVVFAIGTPLIWFGAGLIESSAATLAPRSNIATPALRLSSFSAPVFLWLAVGFALLAVVHGATLHHLLPLLDERNLPKEWAILCASLIGPMQVVGRLAMMAVEKKVSNQFLVTLCFWLMAGAIVLLFVAAALPLLIFGFVLLFGAGYGMVSIVRPVITRDILGGQGFGEKSGGMALFYLTGAALAPWIGSVVWSFAGYDGLLCLLVLMALCGYCMYRIALRYSVARLN